MKSHGFSFGTIATIRRSNGSIKYVLVDDVENPMTSKLMIDDKEIPFKSYTRNFLELIWSSFVDYTYIGDKKYVGGTVPVGSYSSINGSIIGSNSTTRGLFCGTGLTSVAQTDYELDTQIIEGSGAGQLNYNVTGASGPNDIGTAHQLIMNRSITNNSGSQIDITEVGLQITTSWSVTSGTLLLARDVFSAIPIANGATKKIQYLLNSSYSSDKGWHKNFSELLYSMMDDDTVNTGVNHVGAPGQGIRGNDSSNTQFDSAGIGVTTSGIRIGSDNSAFSTAHYNLQSLIANGTSAGQLQYGTSDNANGLCAAPFVEGTDSKMILGRAFTNGSGSSVAINEYDLMAYDLVFRYFQMLRGRFSSTINLDDGETLELQIVFKTSV